jgi:hypothetical protein
VEATACVFVEIYDGVASMVVYQHYSREPPNGAVNNGRCNSNYTADLVGHVSRLSSVIVQPPRVLPALACNSHYAHQ